MRLLENRERVYARARRLNTQRWSRGTRDWARVKTVTLNPTPEREEDIPAPAMETRSAEDSEARFKPQILDVCQTLADTVLKTLERGELPLDRRCHVVTSIA